MCTTSLHSWFSNAIRRACIIIGTVCWLAITLSAHAQPPLSAARDAANVQPFVGEATCWIVKIDPTRLALPAPVESMSAESKLITTQANESLARLRTLVGDQPIYATRGISFSKTPVPTFAFVKKAEKLDPQRLIEVLRREFIRHAIVRGDYVVVNPVNIISLSKQLATMPPTPRTGITTAFEEVEKYPVQVLFLPPQYVLRTMRELPFELPPQLGGGPSSLLCEGVEWATLGIDPGRLRADLVIHSASNAAADALAARLPNMLKAAFDTTLASAYQQVPEKLIHGLISSMKPQVEGNRITVRLNGTADRELTLKLHAVITQTLAENSRRHEGKMRLKQMALAMHNYHDVYKCFPPADKYRGKDGKQHLSWRVHILPFVRQRDLFAQFHLDEPWDSDHNKRLIAKMPDLYKTRSFGRRSNTDIQPGYTTFQAVVGNGAILGGAKAARFQDIRDGTSNTAMLVQVKPKNAVPWTAPEDYAFAPEDPLAGVLIGSDGRWICALADGSIHELRGDAPAETVRRLFQRADGKMVNVSELR